MLVGWGSRGRYGGAPVRWLRVSWSVTGGWCSQGTGDRPGGLRQVCAEATTDLSYLWTW